MRPRTQNATPSARSRPPEAIHRLVGLMTLTTRETIPGPPLSFKGQRKRWHVTRRRGDLLDYPSASSQRGAPYATSTSTVHRTEGSHPEPGHMYDRGLPL